MINNIEKLTTYIMYAVSIADRKVGQTLENLNKDSLVALITITKFIAEADSKLDDSEKKFLDDINKLLV